MPWSSRATLEERTDGEIRIEFIGNNQICGQLSCVEKSAAGHRRHLCGVHAELGGRCTLPERSGLCLSCSQGRASQYHFLYHPESQEILRDPLEKRHGLKFLFSALRTARHPAWSWPGKDAPTVTKLEQLFGTKNRVTGTQLGRIAMKALNLNPVPVAWEETLDGLKQGLIDGAETWASPWPMPTCRRSSASLSTCKFFCGTEHTSMSAKVFDSLDGDLQDAVMESPTGHRRTYRPPTRQRWSRPSVSPIRSLPGTIFVENNVRPAFLPESEIKMAEEMCSPEFQPQLWEQWRDRLNKWAGGIDTYQEIYNVAREVRKKT